MKYGPTLIIACPKCESCSQRGTLRSGNTFGAEIWSDGKMHAPMFHECTQITKCENCDAFYWVEDAKVIGEVFGLEEIFETARCISRMTRRLSDMWKFDQEGICKKILERHKNELIKALINGWEKMERRIPKDVWVEVEKKEIRKREIHVKIKSKIPFVSSEKIMWLLCHADWIKDSELKAAEIRKESLRLMIIISILLKCWYGEDITEDIRREISEQISDKWGNVPYVEGLNVDEYVEAIKSNMGDTKEKELHLREKLWRYINDMLVDRPLIKIKLPWKKIEKNKTIPKKYRTIRVDNLQKLEKLLIGKNVDERIKKAEINRELGNFNKALELLSNIPKDYLWIANKVKKQIGKGNPAVFKLENGRAKR